MKMNSRGIKYLLGASGLLLGLAYSTASADIITDSSLLGSGLTEDIDSYSEVRTYPLWEDIQGKPATALRWPSWNEITSRPALFPTSWTNIQGKPDSFPPSEHNHDGRYLRSTGGVLKREGAQWNRKDGVLNIGADSGQFPEILLEGQGSVASERELRLFSEKNGSLSFNVGGLTPKDSEQVFEVNSQGDLSFAGSLNIGHAIRLRKGGDFDFLEEHADPRNLDRALYVVSDNFGGGFRGSLLFEKFVDPDGPGPGEVKDGGGIIFNRTGGVPGDLKETPPGETALILGRAYDPEDDRFKDVGSVKIVYPEPGAITGEIHFRVNDGTATSDQLRMKLTRDGKLGIGRNIEPREMLHVEGGAIIGVPNGHSEWNNMVLAGEGRFQKDSQVAGAGFVTTPWVYTRAIESDARGSEATLISLGSHNGFTGNDQIGFVTYGELRAIINRHGRMGIGTNAPQQLLHVAGPILADAYNTPSDARLKEKIQPIKNALAKVRGLSGVTYQWKASDSDHAEMGVIAQDVLAAFPEAVTRNEDGFLSVNYSALVAPLIESVKELEELNQRNLELIEELTAENREQKNTLLLLEERLRILETAE